MIYVKKLRNNKFLFLICFDETFHIKVPISENELKFMNINATNLCDQWIPSLSIPILLVPYTIEIKYMLETRKDIYTIIPFFVS